MENGQIITEAEWLARSLVEHERTLGSDDAFADVAEAIGISKWSLWTLYYQRRKSVDYGVLVALKRQYLRICQMQVRRLVAEVASLKKESGNDATFTDLGSEVASVAEKVRQARERHRRE